MNSALRQAHWWREEQTAAGSNHTKAHSSQDSEVAYAASQTRDGQTAMLKVLSIASLAGGVPCNYFEQFKMQGDQLEVVVQIHMRHATNVMLPKFFGVSERLATPHFFPPIAELDPIDLGRMNDATQDVLRIVNLNEIAGLEAASDRKKKYKSSRMPLVGAK